MKLWWKWLKCIRVYINEFTQKYGRHCSMVTQFNPIKPCEWHESTVCYIFNEILIELWTVYFGAKNGYGYSLLVNQCVNVWDKENIWMKSISRNKNVKINLFSSCFEIRWTIQWLKIYWKCNTSIEITYFTLSSSDIWRPFDWSSYCCRYQSSFDFF